MSDAAVDQSRRTWIAITCGAGAVGGAAVAIPFVSTFAPSERAKAAGAPVQVDISALRPGEKLTVEWRGKPVWIVRRTPDIVIGSSSVATRACTLRYDRFVTPDTDEISVLTRTPIKELAAIDGRIASAIESFRQGRVSLVPGGGGRFGSFSFF